MIIVGTVLTVVTVERIQTQLRRRVETERSDRLIKPEGGAMSQFELEELKEMLNRVEQKLDMIIIRLLPHEPLLAEPKRDRPEIVREWLKDTPPENTWKRTHAL